MTPPAPRDGLGLGGGGSLSAGSGGRGYKVADDGPNPAHSAPAGTRSRSSASASASAVGEGMPDCDRRGRCPKHPMVRLYRKKLLGGFEYLGESCPHCDAEAPYEELWRGRSRGAIRSKQIGRLRGNGSGSAGGCVQELPMKKDGTPSDAGSVGSQSLSRRSNVQRRNTPGGSYAPGRSRSRDRGTYAHAMGLTDMPDLPMAGSAEAEDQSTAASSTVASGRSRSRGPVPPPPPPPPLARTKIANHDAAKRHYIRSHSQDSRRSRESSRGRARPRSSSRGEGQKRGSVSVTSAGGASDAGSSLLDRGITTIVSLRGRGGPGRKGRGHSLHEEEGTVTSSRSRGSVRSRSRGDPFDKKTGRCRKHPSVILAKKSTFQKGWEIIRSCPHCAEVRSSASGKGQEGDEFSGVDRRKMEELLGEGSGAGGQRKGAGPSQPRQRSRGRGGRADDDDEVADVPNGNSAPRPPSRPRQTHPKSPRDVPDATPPNPPVTSAPPSAPAAARGASEQSDSPFPARVSRMPFTTPWGESGWYTGQVDSSGRPHGSGRMRYKTGKQYDGEWTAGYSAEYLDNKSRMRSGFGSNVAEWRRRERDEHGNSYKKAAPPVPSVAPPPAQAPPQAYVGGAAQQYYAPPPAQGMSAGVVAYAPPPGASPVPAGGVVPVPGGGQQWYAPAAGPAGTQAAGGGVPVAYPQGYRPR